MRFAIARASRWCLGFGMALSGISLAPVALAGCGPEADACQIKEGDYHIVLPDTQLDEAIPAVMFLHGYGGSGAAALRNRAMVDGLTGRGYAVIAPTALPRNPGGPRSWAFLPDFGGRDESAFFDAILADAEGQFNIDRDAVVLSGFSAGAFMVSYLACASPDQFVAYATVSGSFWRPQPESCAGPIRLMHTHGWADEVVPLEGRYLGNRRFQQGDVFAGLELWRDTNGCSTHAPSRSWSDGDQLRRRWDCGPEADIELVLFAGGHRVPRDWANWLVDWVENSALSQ
ncbi:Poly(3-hydroxybutyrate) depolymerase [Phaeobacter inhibens]|uniref:Poly(3-hydroxybutyrate) depolymerase n=1 Tax=Phaeobacter inhibens TaxID=221822 RepID=A0A2I7LZA0_9RHOB|nr:MULTISPECIES: PHB depolymerase family esterase [Phaeobacter]AUQ50358.1 Poly(3-hydroxybutyrate) depolymerase [Phaeobacter inhibens]AUQ94898.1 Poly(3-hydroxybutyrate) depolymerase [Phaeobacter inhibens]AUQ98671.1 Poly(3-hydroxybutyrate) depolymerase [Phaeobacter inhibens]AUR20163.1 Poly(3-hydroxybutyrate) depolymerase [Phaeobacter inhibens]MBQ4806573.1 polyhydroxybutyrate depolymerase [Phaeobacter sp. HS012]